MPITREKLIDYLNNELDIANIPDRCTNGLECEGSDKISKIGLCTDICMNTVEQALESNCQMLIAHHGFIWGDLKRLTGPLYKILKLAISNGLNLYAAHLPLDRHPLFGNNIQLAHMIGLKKIKPFGLYDGLTIGWGGTLSKPMSAVAIAERFQMNIGGEPTVLNFGKKAISTVAIVSGKGSTALPEAIANKYDCFVTGEPQYNDYHTVRESQMNAIFLGHYYSETCGVMALGHHLQQKFKIKTTFIDNPVW